MIDDEEFALLSELKAAKGRYRSAHSEMVEARSNVEYAETLIENCRAQLLEDFSTWMSAEHPEAAASIATRTSAAASGADGADLAQPSNVVSSSIYGSGGGSSSLVLGLNGGRGGVGSASAAALGGSPSTPYDNDERFEQLEESMALEQDPDSLPFFKARSTRAAQPRHSQRPRSNRCAQKPRPKSCILPFT